MCRRQRPVKGFRYRSRGVRAHADWQVRASPSESHSALIECSGNDLVSNVNRSSRHNAWWISNPTAPPPLSGSTATAAGSTSSSVEREIVLDADRRRGIFGCVEAELAHASVCRRSTRSAISPTVTVMPTCRSTSSQSAANSALPSSPPTGPSPANPRQIPARRPRTLSGSWPRTRASARNVRRNRQVAAPFRLFEALKPASMVADVPNGPPLLFTWRYVHSRVGRAGASNASSRNRGPTQEAGTR